MLKAPRRMRARVLGSEATPGGSSQSTWETISRIHPEEFGQGHWKPLALRENFWENEEKSKLETETETILILNGKFNDRSFLGFPVFTFSRKI